MAGKLSDLNRHLFDLHVRGSLAGATATGCWYFVAPFVFVRWADGTYRTYSVQSFAAVPPQGQ